MVNSVLYACIDSPALTCGVRSSLPQWRSLHLHPPPARRRSEPLRERVRAVESDTERGEDPDIGDEHAGGAE